MFIRTFLFSLRYLAESNCSTRFCRPLPNRSAKVPFACFVLASAKVLIFFVTTKCFSVFFRFFLVLSVFFLEATCNYGCSQRHLCVYCACRSSSSALSKRSLCIHNIRFLLRAWFCLCGRRYSLWIERLSRKQEFVEP